VNDDATIQKPPFASARAWHRFLRKAVFTSNHTIWIGALANDGYGRFHDPDYGDGDLPAGRRDETVRVSRWLWWAWHGPLPARTVVMHTCDLPICVRRDHLRPGTQRENLLMAAGRNRLAHFTAGRGTRIGRADRRGQAGQSSAIRDATRAALAAGITDPPALARIVDDAIALGDHHADQLTLFDIA